MFDEDWVETPDGAKIPSWLASSKAFFLERLASLYEEEQAEENSSEPLKIDDL